MHESVERKETEDCDTKLACTSVTHRQSEAPAKLVTQTGSISLIIWNNRTFPKKQNLLFYQKYAILSQRIQKIFSASGWVFEGELDSNPTDAFWEKTYLKTRRYGKFLGLQVVARNDICSKRTLSSEYIFWKPFWETKFVIEEKITR